MFKDTELTCIQCSKSFIFKAGEQEFFHMKGLWNKPKRCEDCRIYNRLTRAGKSTDVISKVNCADCGAAFIVPFRPTGCKPVYCSTCFSVRKTGDMKVVGHTESTEFQVRKVQAPHTPVNL